MNRSRTAAVLLRSVEDLADAKELRAAIAAALLNAPIDDQVLRCAVWSFVSNERRAGVPPDVVISRLTALIDRAEIIPMMARHALTRRVILWCVEEYFGRLGADMLTSDPSQEPSAPIGL